MTLLWTRVSKASPNHNTANYALELAGLGAIKHVRKASESLHVRLARLWVQVGVRTPDCDLEAEYNSKGNGPWPGSSAELVLIQTLWDLRYTR